MTKIIRNKVVSWFGKPIREKAECRREKWNLLCIYIPYSFYNISFSADGYFIAVASEHKVNFFNCEWKLLWTYELEDRIQEDEMSPKIRFLVTWVSVSSDGSFVVAVGRSTCLIGYKLYFFNRKGNLLWSYNLESQVKNILFSADGSFILVKTSNFLYFFNRKGQILWSYSEFDFQLGIKSIYDISLSADGSFIAAGVQTLYDDDDTELRFFNREGKLLWRYSKPLYSCSLSKDGSFIAATGENVLYFFNREPQLLWSHYFSRPSINSINHDYDKKTMVYALCADGSFIVVGSKDTNVHWSNDNNIYLFNREGKLLWRYKVRESVKTVSLSADGSFIAAGDGKTTYQSRSDKGNIYLFNREGELLWRYETTVPVLKVQVSPNGTFVTAYCKDKVYFFAS